MLVPGPSEDGQAPGSHRGVVDRRCGGFLEPASEPSGRDTAASVAVVLRYEGGELERLVEVDTSHLTGCCLRHQEVAVTERPAEHRPRMAL